MYKHRALSSQKNKPSALRKHSVVISFMTIALSFVSFGFLVPASSGIDSSARVFSEGVKIKLDRNSPAFAALEDTWTPTVSERGNSGVAGLKDVESIPLMVGGEESRYLAAKIMRANQREQSLLAQESLARNARSKAVGEAAAEALRRMMTRFQPNPVKPNNDGNIEQKLEAGTKEVALSSGARETRTISLSELHMSREELLGSLFFPLANSDSLEPAKQQSINVATSVYGVRPRIIQAPRIPSHPEPDRHFEGPIHQQDTQSGQFDGDERKEKTDFEERRAAALEIHKEKKSFDGAPQEQQLLHQVVISGSLEFSDGLALANAQDRVVVYREVDGEPVEHGAVWLRQGSYEIFAEENSGFIIGELRTPYGDVIGRGIVDLSQVEVAGHNQIRLENVKLKIKPILQGISGQVVQTNLDGSNAQVRNGEVVFRDLPFAAKTDRKGHFEEGRLLEGSNSIVLVNRTGSWGTLAFAHTGSENKIEIFQNQDEKMMHHLFSLTRAGDSAIGSNGAAAIIWGRVTQGGKPVSGAHAELLTTAEVVRPIYFNAAMLPDPSLKATTANGLYAFFPVPIGSHAVQAVLDTGSMADPVVFPTENHTVSRVDIEVSTVRQAKIKVFDAFQTNHPLLAEVSSPGSTQVTTIDRSGIGSIRYSDSQGLLILDADAGSAYQKTRITMSRDRRTVFFPMIQTLWLEGLRGTLRLNPEPATGTIIGFIQGSSSYKIALEDKSVLPSSRIVYFNNKGEPVEQSFGEPGGGFVVFNVPEGFRTVTVQPSGSLKMHATVALVDGKVASVISHWIR